jgi:CRP/FNR family transcriptional regulator, cyclic AMP receptor protein
MADAVDDLLEFLPGIALFGGLEESTLRRVISMLKELRLEKGAQVCKQGDHGKDMFVVRSGEVAVVRERESGRRVRMVRLGQGEFFGEMTLIDPQKRSATIVVEQPSVLYALGNRELYRLFQEDVNGYVMILQNLCREMSRRLRTTNARLSQMAEESDNDDSTLIRAPAVRRRP